MAEATSPNHPLTDQAALGYRVVSRLLGRVSADVLSREMKVVRDATSLKIVLVAGDGSETHPPKKTPVTMYIEPPQSSLAGAAALKIVPAEVGERGKIQLDPPDRDREIASLIVQLTAGNVTVGRVPRYEDREAENGAQRSSGPSKGSKPKKSTTTGPAKTTPEPPTNP